MSVAVTEMGPVLEKMLTEKQQWKRVSGLALLGLSA